MKKGILIIGFFIAYSISSFAQTNNNITPSDQVSNTRSETSKISELTAIFNDAIDSPTKYNDYVKPYIQETTFPKKTTNSSLESFNLLLEKWIQDNPEKIKNLLADRQIVHDKLYGPRKK